VRRRTYLGILCICFLTIFSSLGIIQPVAAHGVITVNFYYTSTCSHCREKFPVIQAIEANYSSTVAVAWKELTNGSNMKEWQNLGFQQYPSVLIQNTTKVPSDNITYATLSSIIDNYINELGPGYFQDENIIYVPVFGRIDLKTLSLPVLTLTLGALDSINPCSFFVLFFLLSLLVSMQSRRRMLLVGGIFIFFSGLMYFLFMFVLLNALVVLQNIQLISVAAGAVALVMGVLNIKDFFFFKQGPSLSIPEEKRPELFGRMRRVVRTTYLPTILGGTVFLAATVNFYELLCTLGFPLVYTTQLAVYHLAPLTYYLYLLFYNIVYVVPLIVILVVFTVTLGKAKLSEWRGRQLKLLSGVMILSFGVLFIVDFTVLQIVWVPVLLLVVSVIVTILVSWVMKRRLPPASSGVQLVVSEGEVADPGVSSDSESVPPSGP